MENNFLWTRTDFQKAFGVTSATATNTTTTTTTNITTNNNDDVSFFS
jgi:hypothetical protein